jgi:methionine synthase II (cobalamin-independent)
VFATLGGAYPTTPLPGRREGFSHALERWAAGQLSAEALAEAAAAHAAEVVEEQATAGLGIVDDSGAHWPLDGAAGLARELVGGRVDPATVIGWWRAADAATDVLVKAVLPGPWSFAGGPHGTSTGDGVPLDLLAGRVAACAAGLVAAGCPMVQIDEPALADPGLGAADWARVAATLDIVLDALPDGAHPCLAIPGRSVPVAGHATLARLPFRSYLLDATAGADTWRLIRALPPERGIIVGAADARSPAIDDPEMMVWAATLAAELDGRGVSRVGIATSGSMAPLDRHAARRKIESMGTAVQLTRMGPLGEVARALQPDPAAARIPSLRRLIADHEASATPEDHP